MKKNNMAKLLGVALVVAIICTGLFYMMFAMKANSQTGATIVVAAKALRAGTVLKAEDLKTVNWSAAQLPPGAHGNPEEIVGNTVFDPMAAEEPVLNARLATSLSGGGSGVPVGMRAVSDHLTDSTGVLDLLRGGQKVDVQVVMGRGAKPEEVQVRTALENLTVLSVNPQPEPGSQGQNLPVVTLLAKPEQVDVLAAADSGGRVRLALRNPLDKDTHSRSALSLSSVMRGGTRGDLAEDR
jgi:pilus assembly protein CpaB